MTDPTFPTAEPIVLTTGIRHRKRLPGWRREALRTTFWVAPVLMVLAAGILFAITVSIDLEAYDHHLTLPFWIRAVGADAARQVLISIAAAVITVIGVVFSITILALTLASQQFGPRMMRNFMRDLGNQLTLGVFVGTFVYAVLTLGFIVNASHGPFTPHLSITVSEALLLVDLGVLIYFIHHIAKSIQLPEVISRIAEDLFTAIDTEFPEVKSEPARPEPVTVGPSFAELEVSLRERGVAVPAASNGYLQFVALGQLIEIASKHDAVIRLTYRPGHFILAGRPIATVVPGGAAEQVRAALTKAHLTGAHRTLSQDPVFAIDQLVEIAIRALSSAVNDTFTALTCIDWLSAGLSQLSERVLGEGVYRDGSGRIRLIEQDPSYARMINRGFDKVRQAGRGMPAVLIRLMDSITHIIEYTREAEQREHLLLQARMIMEDGERSIEEEKDLADLRRRYEACTALAAFMNGSTAN